MTEVKRRKRKSKKKKMPTALRLGVLVTVLVLVIAAMVIMITPAFGITEVYCEGCNNLKTEDVVASAQIENGTHILLANIGKARRLVEENPLVKDVEVRRVFPDKICIKVTERIPAGYVMRGTECNIIDSEGIVLEVINDSRANLIVKENTPEPAIEKKQDDSAKKDDEEKNKKNVESSETDESDEENGDKAEENSEESKEGNSEGNSEENSEEIKKPYDIPLVAGVECEATEPGRLLKATDEEKFDKVIAILNALKAAQLLERTTYVDVADMSDIRIIVENRLDIYVGKGDNIDYRAKFMAEVINTKISSYEKAVMDYHGDDIFVRAPEDGKDRIYKEKTKSDEDDSEDKNSDEEESDKDSEKEKKSDKKSDDKKDDGEETDDNTKTEDDEESEDDSDSDEKSQTNMSLDE